MQVTELCHEAIPHSRPALFEDLGANGKFLGCQSVPAPPSTHLCEQWHQLNRRFGKAVNSLLLVSRIVSSRR